MGQLEVRVFVANAELVSKPNQSTEATLMKQANRNEVLHALPDVAQCQPTSQRKLKPFECNMSRVSHAIS